MDIQVRTILLAVIAAHLMADFWLQTYGDVAAKRQLRFRTLLKHAVTHAVVVYLFAGLWTVWQIPLVVLVSHPLIDGTKEALLRWFAPRDAKSKPETRWKFWSIVIDQIFHLAVLAATVEFLSRYGVISVEPCWSVLLGAQLWQKFLVLLSGAILAISTGGVLIGILVKPMLQEIQKAHQPNGAAEEQRGLKNGGRLIGQLERTLILILVLSAQPAGVGFLIAAKSIFRFGELKDDKTRMEAEYIIIGTMLSFIWALTIAWTTQWVFAAI